MGPAEECQELERFHQKDLEYRRPSATRCLERRSQVLERRSQVLERRSQVFVDAV